MTAARPIRAEHTDKRRGPVAVTQRAVDPTDEPDPFFGGVPQNVLDSEGVFLSALLAHPENFAPVAALLRPEQFYATVNQRVFESMLAVYDEHATVDLVLLANRMRNQGTLTQVGGTPYLATLADCQPATAHPRLHAAEIVEAWKQRELMACMARQAILLRHGQASHVDCYQALKEHFKAVGK